MFVVNKTVVIHITHPPKNVRVEEKVSKAKATYTSGPNKGHNLSEQQVTVHWTPAVPPVTDCLDKKDRENKERERNRKRRKKTEKKNEKEGIEKSRK